MKQTIVLYPAPGIGHIISMVELGKLLLHHSHNFSITILLTTGMLDKPDIDSYLRRISHSYPSISFRRFPLLSLKPAASPRSPTAASFEFVRLNSTNVASALTDIISQKFEIRALVIDIFCTSAMDIASSLGIPVYYFFTSGAAVLSALLYLPKIHEQTTQSFKDLSIDLNIPANPPLKAFHMVEPSLDRDDPAYWDFLYFCSHLSKSKGIMVNTFQDLEPKAVKIISEGICFPDPKQAPPVYYIGPLIAEPKDQKEDIEDSGRIPNCLAWLEKQPSRSVVFLCFGSRGSMSVEQLKEIANGLEQSEVRFLWVVKRPPEDERMKQTEDTTVNFDLESVLPGGFMERTRDRGMVVRSWAPQVEVLARESVGGFVTHCGWNSVLESVVAGVPMIGWPLYAEQHMNRNLMVEEMKIAVGLEHRDEDGFVKGDEFEKKVRELMESEKGKEMKERMLKMRVLAESARGSLGSSTRALSNLAETWVKGN